MFENVPANCLEERKKKRKTQVETKVAIISFILSNLPRSLFLKFPKISVAIIRMNQENLTMEYTYVIITIITIIIIINLTILLLNKFSFIEKHLFRLRTISQNASARLVTGILLQKIGTRTAVLSMYKEVGRNKRLL